ncbi:MAG: Connector [Bacteriophage sp.]|nr:MAG: Connector [Bacteriophage sp.]
MNRKGRKAQSEAFLQNQRTYLQYVNRLTELSISMFDWKNLPNTIDARFLELALFNDGMAVFFKDEVMGYLGLQVMIGGTLDVYRIPITRTAFAQNGYQMKLDQSNSVIIFNNMLHTNSILDVQEMSKRLYEIQRTIDVNVIQQKTPKIITCTENQRLVMKNLYAQYMGNEPFIFGDKNLDLSGIKTFDTTSPYVADKLYDLKTQYWNEALTYLGISNVNTVKKERMITDEVQRNLGGTIASRYSRLFMRQQACEQINKMFGLNISVDYREDMQVLDTYDANQANLSNEIDIGKGGEK